MREPLPTLLSDRQDSETFSSPASPMPAVLSSPSRLVRQAVDAENELRRDYLSFDGHEVEELCDGVELADLLAKSAALLRALLAGACSMEILELQKGTHAVLTWDEMCRRITVRTGLDPAEVVREVERNFVLPTTRTSEAKLSLAAVVRAVKATLSQCPIDALQAAANEHAMAPLGHQCRVAYDGLQAFVLRTDPSTKERVRVVGEAYQSGSLTPSEVALLLGCGNADAISILEDHGYARPLEHIRLSPDRRASLLAALRQSRETDQRTWRTPSEEETVRDVVASERIEGVDARGWL